MQDVRERIALVIEEAASEVARMTPSGGARELATRLEEFRRILATWGPGREPSPDAVNALAREVEQVRRIARETAPTMKRKRIEP